MTLFLLLCTLSFSTINAAESTLTISKHYCSSSSTFTSNSTYQADVKLVLRDLVSNGHPDADKRFFFTSSEAVFGSFMCKGDVLKEECAECVNNASFEITRICQMTKVSILWYNQCLLRYSDANFSSTVEMKPLLDGYNRENTEKPDELMKLLNKTMNHAVREAAQHSPRMYGHRNAKFTSENKLRTFAQCV